MDVLDAISYNKDFQESVVKSKTDNFNPIQEIIGNKYKAIEFTNKIFEQYPELMDGKASTLYYILNAGQSKKTSVLYASFDAFVQNSQPSTYAKILSGIEPVNMDVDPLFSWARYIKKTKKCYIYEPVLSYNNKALQEFLNTKTFKYNDRVMTLKDIRPLCYINTGENIADLLPYIAYLYNFFINCNSYTFGEILAGSTHNSFFESIEANFTKYYQKLLTSANGLNLTKLFAKPAEITKHFSITILKSMYAEMLNPENIVQIRNSVIMNDTTKQLQKAVSTQASVTRHVVQAGYIKVMGDLIDILVKKNPITKLYNKIPTFNGSTLNEYELGQWTSYALAGGDTSFMINRDLTVTAIGDADTQRKFAFLPDQKLRTEIKTINVGAKKAFLNSSIGLNLISAYAKMKFNENQNDFLNDYPITIDESFIATEKHGANKMEDIITGLFVNGVYGREWNSMHAIFDVIGNNPRLTATLGDIINIPRLYEMLFDNIYGSKILSAYILSFMPEWLEAFMTSNGAVIGLDVKQTSSVNLMKFCPMAMFCQIHSIDYLRIEKLLALETSIMYLHNKSYTNFINEKAEEMFTILTKNAYIQQPFVKGTSDMIDVYAIGGRELVAKAGLSNPMLRAYWFVNMTQGSCSELETFYEWAKYVNNNHAFDMLALAIKDKDANTIKKVLTNKYNELISSSNSPVLLDNYEIRPDGTWSTKSTAYFTDLRLPDGTPIVEFLMGFAYGESHAKNIADDELVMKPIVYHNGNFIAKKAGYNKAIFGDKSVTATLSEFGVLYKLPYYDFNAVLDEFGIEVAAPSGYNLINIITDSGRQQGNDVYFVYTPLQTVKFNGKKFANNFDDVVERVENPSFDTELGNRPDHKEFTQGKFDPRKPKSTPMKDTDRMFINGLDRKPIPKTSTQ